MAHIKLRFQGDKLNVSSSTATLVRLNNSTQTPSDGSSKSNHLMQMKTFRWFLIESLIRSSAPLFVSEMVDIFIHPFTRLSLWIDPQAMPGYGRVPKRSIHRPSRCRPRNRSPTQRNQSGASRVSISPSIAMDAGTIVCLLPLFFSFSLFFTHYTSSASVLDVFPVSNSFFVFHKFVFLTFFHIHIHSVFQ